MDLVKKRFIIAKENKKKIEAILWEIKYFSAVSLVFGELNDTRRGMIEIMLISKATQKKNSEWELIEIKILSNKIKKKPRFEDKNKINF